MKEQYEYFYKNDHCKAADAHAGDCICWHKQGTGPYSNAWPEDPMPDQRLNWRQARKVDATGKTG